MFDTDEIPPLFHGAPQSGEFRKLRKRIVRLSREAIDTYGMARRGDCWLVCLSGGKDSYTLLAALTELKWRGLLPVDLLVCNLDQGQPGFPATVLRDGAEAAVDALRDWINGRLAARYQRVREVVVLHALPRNIAGKTLKRELRERYLAARAG